MLLIDREFIGDFFKALGALLFLVAIVVLIDTLLDKADKIFGTADNGLYWGLLYFVCSLPRKIVDTAAIVSGASIIWLVTRKARNNEIVAYLAGGISPRRLAAPLIAAAFVVSIISLSMSEFLVSSAERRAERINRVQFERKSESALTRNKHIYQKGSNKRFYIVDSFDSSTNVMSEVTIIDLHEKRNIPQWMLRAKTARLVGEGKDAQWRFENGSIRTYDDQSNQISFKGFDQLAEKELDRPMEDRLEDFLGELDDPKEMSITELYHYVRLLESQGKGDQVRELKVALHLKPAMPLAALVVAMLACAHVLRPVSRGIFMDFGGGLAWIVVYFVVLLGASELGKTGLIPFPVLTVWLPFLGFGGYAMLSLLKHKT